MGKRYTREEIDQIQILNREGLTDGQIATRLGRTQDGIRNIRHRMKLKTTTRETVRSLRKDIRQLRKTKTDARA